MTENETLKKELERANARVKEFTQNINAAVWSTENGSAVFEYMSDGSLGVMGVPSREFLETPHRFPRMIFRPDRRIAIDALRKLRAGINVQCEFRIQVDQGATRMLNMEATPILDSSTGQLRFTGSFTDVTVLRTMLDSLRAAEQRMRAVVESVGDGIVIINDQGQMQSINASAAHIFGYTAQETLGKDLILFFGGEQRRSFESALDWHSETFGEAAPAGREIVVGRRKDGSEFPMEIDLRKIQSVSQIHFVAVLQDISERRAREELLRQSEKNAAINTLAAGVAHEFKNCLGGIMMNATLAQSVLDKPELLREPLEEIICVSEKADTIAKSLLSYSGGALDDKAATDVERVGQEVTSLLDDTLQESGILLRSSLSGLPPVAIVAGDLEQVFLSVIVNAIHATERGGVISLSGSLDDATADRRVIVEISDTGCGMSEEVLQRCFDPFYSTKGVWGNQEVPGAGLGLTIARNLIEKAGGSVRLTSAENVGTTMTISVKQARSDSPQTGVKTNLLRSTL